MKKYKHDLGHTRLITLQGGQVMPIGCVEVLPGDDLLHAVHALVRATPQNAPIMQPTQVCIESYFVPNRITSEPGYWQGFIAGDEDDIDPYQYNNGDAGFDRLADALGVGQVQSADDLAVPVNPYPFKAYNQILNDYFFHQDLQTPLPVIDAVEGDYDIRRCLWPRDYFTTGSVEAQKGDAVTIPIGGTAPVVFDSDRAIVQGVYDADDDSLIGTTRMSGTNALEATATNTGPVYLGFDPSAQLSAETDLSLATSVPITDLRFALKLQAQRERRARYGSKYDDILLADYGIHSLDSRLQQAEYLGGGRQRINWSEVLNTASADSGIVGEMFGHGIGQTRSNRYRYKCQEHGYVITVMYIRPASLYTTATPRHFFKFVPEDYFVRDFEHVGQQPVLLQELYPGDTTSGTVLCYQDRYREYREQFNQVSREFLTTLNFWHFGRIFGTTPPALNASFITCTPTNRVFQDTSDSTDKYWVHVNHDLRALRVVGRNASPSMR